MFDSPWFWLTAVALLLFLAVTLVGLLAELRRARDEGSRMKEERDRMESDRRSYMSLLETERSERQGRERAARERIDDARREEREVAERKARAEATDARLREERAKTQALRELEQWKAVESERMRIAQQKVEAELRQQLFEEARQRATELFTQRQAELLQLAQDAARIELAEWKAKAEREIRADASKKSSAVLSGKSAEVMAPFLNGFPFNPRDARFLGSPIDYVVFDGLVEGDVRNIIFLELKTASAGLSQRQRLIREAVRAGRFQWLEGRIDEAGQLQLGA